MKEMNHVERFRAVMNFQEFDRLPRVEWATYWTITLDRWQSEGLATRNRYEIFSQFGLDPYYQHWFGARPLSFFKPEKHGQPLIHTADDYREIRKQMFPPPEAAQEKLQAWNLMQKAGEIVMWGTLDGFFWLPRGLLGIENHLYAFYDKPELMHMINQDVVDYAISVLKYLAGVCPPTFVTIAEDMSYNHGAMISKELFDQFIAPYYRQIVPILDEMGTTIIIDSDGQVEDLMRWFAEVGVEGILPLERQAGCDAQRLRQVLPRTRIIGHFDKLVIKFGRDAIEKEFQRLLPVMKAGGFIPSVDHQTPPEVSMDQYRIYTGLLAEYAELAAR